MTEPQVYSGEYWRTRSPEELREIADGSFPGGEAYEGAMAEIARREAAQERADARDKAGEQMRWTKRTFWVAVAAVAATILAALTQMA